MTDDESSQDPQHESEPQDVLESAGVHQVITRRRALLLGGALALIAVVAGAALIVRNERSAPEAPTSVVQAADEAANAQCELLGYMRPAEVPACHHGFVTGAMVVHHEIPPGWSANTERKATYAATVVLSQADARLHPFGNKLMRSKAWVEGFQSGVLYEAREMAANAQTSPQSLAARTLAPIQRLNGMF
jgi:hypothetical protein